MKIKKIIVLMFSLFLFISCNSENKIEYKEELKKLETLLKKISSENENELKNLDFNSNANFESKKRKNRNRKFI